MRILIHLFIAASFLLAGQTQLQAQEEELSKDEKKAWKQQAKEYKRNPAALKELVEEHESFQRENRELQLKNTQLEAAMAKHDAEVAQLQQETDRLTSSLAAAQETIMQLRQEREAMASKGTTGNAMQGLVFRVQIGAYEKANLSSSLDNPDDNMDLEMQDGLQKIIIGRFRDYADANEMRKYMQKIGIKDAWVVPYRDGQRITLKEAGIDVNQ